MPSTYPEEIEIYMCDGKYFLRKFIILGQNPSFYEVNHCIGRSHIEIFFGFVLLINYIYNTGMSEAVWQEGRMTPPDFGPALTAAPPPPFSDLATSLQHIKNPE